MTLGFIRDMKT